MEENKDTYSQTGNKESPNEKIQFLIKKINKLSTELETVKKSIQKRRSENATLKVLLYTGLFVLLVGFLYSNSVLQRAHMRSLEGNILSLERRLSHDMNQIKMNLELDMQKQLKSVNSTDIFTILGHMDYAISQVRTKKEQTAMLINQVRLNTDEFSRLLKSQIPSPKYKKDDDKTGG